MFNNGSSIFRGFLLKCSTMAHQSLHSPTNPHFFQPLLPGFHTHLVLLTLFLRSKHDVCFLCLTFVVCLVQNIPVAFFSKHVQGRNKHIKTAKLRTDASAKTWLVKINGLRFTDGWEDFAVAHELRIGDIIIFRHEGEMVFHVTAFGPSCCDIQYTSASSHNIIDDSQDQANNTGTICSMKCTQILQRKMQVRDVFIFFLSYRKQFRREEKESQEESKNERRVFIRSFSFCGTSLTLKSKL